MKRIYSFLVPNKSNSLAIKLVTTIFVIGLLIFSFVINKSTYNFYDVFACGNISSYCYVYDEEDFKENSTFYSNNKLSIKCVKNGSKWFINFKNKNVEQNINPPQYKQVMGYFDPKLLQKTLKTINAKFIKEENYNNIKILFYYTPVWQNFRVVGNSKVNLQIAITKTITTIGYPMIYGAF